MAIAGSGWLTFLSPPLAHSYRHTIWPPGLLGEGSVMLWLVVMGVNVQRWKEGPKRRGNGNRSAPRTFFSHSH